MKILMPAGHKLSAEGWQHFAFRSFFHMRFPCQRHEQQTTVPTAIKPVLSGTVLMLS
jgi:hypothetical protein